MPAANSSPRSGDLSGEAALDGPQGRLNAAAVSGRAADAFRLRVEGGSLRIVGGGPSGVLYGVYELLERFGECGWFAPWCETVPERESFEVPGDLDFSDAPAFDQRTASWLHTRERNTAGGDAFSAKMRFKHTNGTKAKFGGPGVRYAWGRICRNLRIYDYCTNFRNYLYPFPDLMALAPNYRLFRDNGVRWLGSQGGYVHADMAELKCYVQSKLMWNPDQPVMPLVERFCEGYYGAAAPKVREYLGKLYEAFGITLDDSADPDERPAFGGIYSENLPWLDDSFCAEARRLWDEAEEAVKDDPVRLSNVRMGRMAVLYRWRDEMADTIETVEAGRD